MRARVYNKSKNIYYISEVYGAINRAGEWYIVDDVDSPDRVVLVEYLDCTTEIPYRANVEMIDTSLTKDNTWIYIDRKELDTVNEKLIQSKKLHYYRGYDFVWKSQEGLIELAETNSATKASLGIGEVSTKIEGWNYIETQEDIDRLMEEFRGFHDAVLRELSYVSGDYYDKEEHVTYINDAGSKQVRVVFDSEWTGQIEMILLAPRVVHMIPGVENDMPVLYDALMVIENCMVYFYDSYMKEIPSEYDGTYFKSMGIMWRFIDRWEG